MVLCTTIIILIGTGLIIYSYLCRFWMTGLLPYGIGFITFSILFCRRISSILYGCLERWEASLYRCYVHCRLCMHHFYGCCLFLGCYEIIGLQLLYRIRLK